MTVPKLLAGLRHAVIAAGGAMLWLSFAAAFALLPRLEPYAYRQALTERGVCGIGAAITILADVFFTGVAFALLILGAWWSHPARRAIAWQAAGMAVARAAVGIAGGSFELLLAIPLVLPLTSSTWFGFDRWRSRAGWLQLVLAPVMATLLYARSYVSHDRVFADVAGEVETYLRERLDDAREATGAFPAGSRDGAGLVGEIDAGCERADWRSPCHWLRAGDVSPLPDERGLSVAYEGDGVRFEVRIEDARAPRRHVRFDGPR